MSWVEILLEVRNLVFLRDVRTSKFVLCQVKVFAVMLSLKNRGIRREFCGGT